MREERRSSRGPRPRSRAAHFKGSPQRGRTGTPEAGPESLSLFEFDAQGASEAGRGPPPARSPPGAPRRRAGRRLKGVGGWVFPLWVFLGWGAPRKGGFQRGKTKAGGERRALCSLPAGRLESTFREGGGQAALKPRAVSVRELHVDGAGRRAARLEKNREAKSAPKRGRTKREERSGRHSGARASCLLPRHSRHLVQARGPCGAARFSLRICARRRAPRSSSRTTSSSLEQRARRPVEPNTHAARHHCPLERERRTLRLDARAHHQRHAASRARGAKNSRQGNNLPARHSRRENSRATRQAHSGNFDAGPQSRDRLKEVPLS